jgi:hypothetical protein
MGRWQKIVIPEVQAKLKTYSYRPTVRGMFYNLVSDNVIPNTQQAYKGLINAISIAVRNCLIPINAFADNTRQINDISDLYQNPQNYTSSYINALKGVPEHYFDNIPRWHKQPHYVEIMVEKNALRGLFAEIVESENLQVRVVPNNGWSSRVFKHETLNRLLRKSQSNDVDDNGNPIKKQFHILYFGDYDPTGRRIDMNLSLDLFLLKAGFSDRRLEKKSKDLRSNNGDYEGQMYDYIEKAKEHRIFERIALTHDQINEFGLQDLKNPDPEVLRKLEKDPNAQAFINENGSLFQIELDAMQKEGMKDRFKDLVVNSVTKYFDNRIYEEIMQEHSPEELRKMVRDMSFGVFY